MSQRVQTIQIEGITCDACIKLITKKFSTIPGVSQVVSVAKNGIAEVCVEESLPKEIYEQALAGMLYFVIAVH